MVFKVKNVFFDDVFLYFMDNHDKLKHNMVANYTCEVLYLEKLYKCKKNTFLGDSSVVSHIHDNNGFLFGNLNN